MTYKIDYNDKRHQTDDKLQREALYKDHNA